MSREYLTDAEVELEIERLTACEAVKLARAEQRLQYKRRQYLYQLRWYEKRGKELEKQGVTIENMESQLKELERAVPDQEE